MKILEVLSFSKYIFLICFKEREIFQFLAIERRKRINYRYTYFLWKHISTL